MNTFERDTIISLMKQIFEITLELRSKLDTLEKVQRITLQALLNDEQQLQLTRIDPEQTVQEKDQQLEISEDDTLPTDEQSSLYYHDEVQKPEEAESLHTHEEECIELDELDDENVVQLTHQTPSCILDECIEVNNSDDEDEVQPADLTPCCMLEEYLDPVETDAEYEVEPADLTPCCMLEEYLDPVETVDEYEVQPADLTPSCMIEECVDLVESDVEEVVQLEIVHLPQETQFYLNLFQKILPDLDALLCTEATPEHAQNSREDESTIYNCDECGKRFYRKRNLTKHLKIHSRLASGDKNIECKQCDSTFNLASDFIMHQIIHYDKMKSQVQRKRKRISL